MVLLKWMKNTLFSATFVLAIATLLIVSPVLSFQSGSEPIPAATLTPTNTANIRNLPSTKGTDIIGQAEKGTQYSVLGFATRDDGKWYDLGLPEGGYGWVRSDVVPAPEGDEIWDLTEVAAVPVLNDDALPPEQLVDMNINLALVKSAFDALANGGAAPEIFTPDNIRLIGIQGQNLIFQLRNAVQNNEAGTLLTIIGNENGAQDEALFSPVQLRDLLGKNGVQVDGEFEVSKSSDPYLWFGRMVLFNYEQATSELSQGTDIETALLASAVVSDTPFPDTSFSISKTDTGSQIVFITGIAFDLSQNAGERFLRAKKLDVTVMTPFVVATQLGLPQGNYTFDTNPTYGPNKMLKDASGNIAAVTTAAGDIWQTAETVRASLNLDTKDKDGKDLHYFFDATDPANLFLREQRDELHGRGVQAILDETDGTWHNLRMPFEQIVTSYVEAAGYGEDLRERDQIFFTGISAGVRTDLQIPIPGTDAVGTKFIRTYLLHYPKRIIYDNLSDLSLETVLVTLDLQFQGAGVYMFGDGTADFKANTKGIEFQGMFPLDRRVIEGYLHQIEGNGDDIKAYNKRNKSTVDFLLSYFDNKQDFLTLLGESEVVHEPLVLNIINMNDLGANVRFP